MRIDISLLHDHTAAKSSAWATQLRPCARSMALIAALGVLALGCVPTEEQRLDATGELRAPDRHTPMSDTLIELYEITFTVDGDNGEEVAIRRSFTNNGRGDDIITDGGGRFKITASNLTLSYNWERDEYECENVCSAWDTVCTDVSEEVCDVCTENECWDDCYEECDLDCWDEKFCDEDGNCWTETICKKECDDICQTVCEPVDYDCNCRWETYQDCNDECVETVDECEWVTRNYTSHPSLDEVKTTSTAVWTRDDNGNQRIVTGEPVGDGNGAVCDRGSECNGRAWIQTDLFIMQADTAQTPRRPQRGTPLTKQK